ncbi:unnamed protein product [Rotaria socialis]
MFMCSNASTAIIAWLSFTLYVAFIGLCGCIIYAKYNQCDHLRTKRSSKPDQSYPVFVLETLGQYPGLTGLFTGGSLSASLSTISSGINSMATVIVEDIYKRIIVDHSMSRRKQEFVSKIRSLLILFFAFIVSYLVDHVPLIIFQLAGSFVPPILGIYLLGFFAPQVNSRCSGSIVFVHNISNMDSPRSSSDPKTVDQSLLISWKDSLLPYSSNKV